MSDMQTSLRTRLRSALVALATLTLASGCHKTPPSANAGRTASSVETSSGVAAGPADAKDKKTEGDSPEGLHLTAVEVEKLGVTTAVLQTLAHAPEASGFGVVISHETVAQALADLRTAAAVAHQSQSALERGQRLAGTPGAMPLDALEAAQRQSTVDQAALALARQRLSSTFGQDAPWKSREASPILSALASGTAKLVRVTFPMSSVAEATPSVIRLGRIGVAQTAGTWDSSVVWEAPADATVPGRSFFTIFQGSRLGEGERLLAWTPVGEPQDGVLIPAAATLVSTGKYWFYIEEKPGIFVRTELDPGAPVSGGYFVNSGVQAGDKVVVKAAGQLLAKELNPSTEAE